MDAIEALKTRRSVRKYLEKPVPKEIIEDILDTARLAPSANNIQPWEFVVVTNAELRQKIAQITDYGKFIAHAPVCIIVFCKDTKYYLEDGSAATENILVAARAYGLGTCWVAGDKKRYVDQIRELVGVPADYKLVSLVSLGYPAETPSPPAKRKLTEMVHWEKFSR